MSDDTAENLARFAATIPNEQAFVYKITPLPGRLMMLANVGEQLKQLGKLCAEIGKDMSPPQKLVSCLEKIETLEDGSIEFSVIVMPLKDRG
jgi:hypothetical protein